MRKLLIIDDEPDTLELIRQIFTEYAYKVFMAATGKEGLTLARQTKPDLVLLDLRLPDIKGEELLPLFKKDLPETKVIVGSAYAGEEGKKKELLALGAAAVYDKPIVMKEFRKAVNAFIGLPTALKVLLIDDDKGFAEELKFFFDNDAETKWEFFSASSGEEGFRKIEEFWPDLVLLDLVLSTDESKPFHSGVEVFQEIKKKYFVPVVVLAGHPDAYDGASLSRTGIAAIFAKDELIGGPDSIQHILNALKSISVTWSNSVTKRRAS